VDLKPGTYVLYDADMSLQGGTVTCSTCTPGGAGVTFVFTGSSPSKVGTVTINGGASMQLNAPGSGTYAGVVMYRDALATDQTSKINGGSGLNLIGGMYFPTSTLDFQGNTGVSFSNVCRVVVAATVTFTGNANFTDSTRDCAADKTAVAETQTVRLVE
jgi:hypothetical protein